MKKRLTEIPKCLEKVTPDWYARYWKNVRTRQNIKIKEKWYSGWTLAFWIIFFWPGAIIYMVIKSSDRQNERN